jgi:hypothetical protein
LSLAAEVGRAAKKVAMVRIEAVIALRIGSTS